LRRYLACAVPRGDISDRRIDELIDQLEHLPLNQASDRFLAFSADVHPRRLLWKLRVRVEQMDARLARHIALIIAASGRGIPGPTDKDFLFSPLSSAALLVRLLLARIEQPSDRLAAARDVLAIAEPLAFAQLCFQSMRAQNDGMDILIQDVSELEALLSDRIVEFARTASLLKAFPTGIDWLILLLQWQKNRGSEELHAYYRRALGSDANESVALVRSQLGLKMPGGPFSDDFQVEHYNHLALVADPEDVYHALKEVNRSGITPQDAKLIRQFEALHEQRQKTPVEVSAD
jgi:hypothetical protein